MSFPHDPCAVLDVPVQHGGKFDLIQGKHLEEWIRRDERRSPDGDDAPL